MDWTPLKRSLFLGVLILAAIFATVGCSSGPTRAPTETSSPAITASPVHGSPTSDARSVASASEVLTQVIPPMESLSEASARCLGSRAAGLEVEAGAMFTPILKSLVECLTPQELARTRTYVPPGGGPAQELDFVCNDAWYASIEAMLDHFGVGIPYLEQSSNPGGNGIRFKERGAEAGVAFQHFRDDAVINLGGGTAAGDYNGDGLLDIYVTNSAGPNALYRNDGGGHFTDVAPVSGVDDHQARGYGAGWADYDNDGDLDLFVASFGDSKLFRNNGPRNGEAGFDDVTGLAGVGDPDDEHRTMGVSWGDYDRDGYLDLLVVRHVDEPGGKLPLDTEGLAKASRPLALYHNMGDGTFENVTALLGDGAAYPSPVRGAGFKPSFIDYDNDGDADIYVINDFGSAHHPNVLWRNDGLDASGAGTFTDVSKESGADLEIFGMGLATGDYDNDGDLDFYMTNIGANEFLENQGDGTFIDRTEQTGTGRGSISENWFDNNSVSWGAVFADLDNDGLLDLYSVAGHMDNDPCFNMLNQPNAIFANNGDGSFSDESRTSGADDPGTGRGVVHGDFNNDGQIDLFVVNLGYSDGTPGTARLFENASDNTNHWLDVKVVGTTSNRDGIGARIKITTTQGVQIREMGASQSHMSHSVVPVHFGLGPAGVAASVEVSWPSGQVQVIRDVPAGQTLTVIEP
jgi:hypothetical protein